MSDVLVTEAEVTSLQKDPYSLLISFVFFSSPLSFPNLWVWGFFYSFKKILEYQNSTSSSNTGQVDISPPSLSGCGWLWPLSFWWVVLFSLCWVHLDFTRENNKNLFIFPSVLKYIHIDDRILVSHYSIDKFFYLK